jgi:hypothetical protein
MKPARGIFSAQEHQFQGRFGSFNGVNNRYDDIALTSEVDIFACLGDYVQRDASFWPFGESEVNFDGHIY